MPIDSLSVLCAQQTRDPLAIAKFLFDGDGDDDDVPSWSY